MYTIMPAITSLASKADFTGPDFLHKTNKKAADVRGYDGTRAWPGQSGLEAGKDEFGSGKFGLRKG